MGFQENDFTVANLIGNVDVPRNVTPVLRAAVRRSDPTGAVSAPFYPSLDGKKLDIEYTDANLVIQTKTIAFTSVDYAAALAAVATVDAANIEVVDMDGFLAIKSRNAGDTHYLKALPQAVTAEEAAVVLGLVTFPFPGSISYAGEVASAAGTRKQNNPHGTILIAKNEDLSAMVLNRAFVSLLHYIQRDKIGLDRESTVVETRGVTLLNNPAVAAAEGIVGGAATAVANVFVVNDATLRLPIGFFTDPDPDGPALEDIFRFTRDGADVLFSQTNGGGRYRVRSVHYSNTPLVPDFRSAALLENTFAVWGTPDHKSIFGSVADLVRKDKHAAVDITKVQGDRITCPGALFQTRHVQKGDTVRITNATSALPFSHNGEFVVDRVWDEENLSLRPKSPQEPLVFENENRPSELNNVPDFGQATVPIGYFLPASNLVFTIEHVGGVSWGLLTGATGTFGLLLKTGKSLRDATVENLSRELNVSPDSIVGYIDDHIASGGHPADSINWDGAQPVWDRTAEEIPGENLETLLLNLVAMLSDHESATTAEGGAGRIGSPSITGDSPNHVPLALSAGSLKSQLKSLLQQINGHMLDAAAHAGGGGAYSGSPDWKDGTSIGAGVSIDAAIDRIVTDLGGSGGANGAAKVAVAARSSWTGGRTNGADSVFGALQKIVSDLGASTSDDDGAERIGAGGYGTDLVVGSVRSQLNDLANRWGRLSRNNIWTEPQTVNGASAGGAATDPQAAIVTTVTPGIRKLLWQSAMTSQQRWRIYVTTNGFEFTQNARWDGANWAADQTGAISGKFVFNANSFSMWYYSGGAASFSNSAWVNRFDINTQPATGISPDVENQFTARQRFEGAISGTPDINASLYTHSASNRKLLWDMPSSGTKRWRLYSGPYGYEITDNAAWNGSSWMRDASGTPAIKYFFSSNGVYYQKIDSPGVTWPATDWISSVNQRFNLSSHQQLAKAHGWVTVASGGALGVNAYPSASAWIDPGGLYVGISLGSTMPVYPHIIVTMRQTSNSNVQFINYKQSGTDILCYVAAADALGGTVLRTAPGGSHDPWVIDFVVY